MTYHKHMHINHHLFTKRIYEKLAPNHLSPGQPKVLEYLRDHDGSVQKDIAAACLIEPATLTVLLSGMAKKGLICRKTPEDNRRLSQVFLTDFGREQADFVMQNFLLVDSEALAGFSPEEKAQFKSYMDRVHTNLEHCLTAEGGK